MAHEELVKLKAGSYWVQAKLKYEGNRIFVNFPFNRKLLAHIKAMKGRKWHGFETPPKKIWSIENCQRNAFRLDALRKGRDPFKIYDVPLLDIQSNRPLREHQLEMKAVCLTRKHCILAGEMGTGKTLVAIEVMEHIKEHERLENYEAWYIGPKAGVRAVSRELIKWSSTVKPIMYTYKAFTKVIENWNPSDVLPKVVIFDESSKLKTPTSKRSQAAMHLVESMMTQHSSSYVIEMTGTPAPKAPTDWFWQAEIACPGFLKESTIHDMKSRLSIIEERESIAGGSYPHIVTWLDDSRKCAECGELAEHVNHDEMATVFGGDGTKIHAFKESVNEVHLLYKRLNGLVDIKMKKDCLDLPEKQYRVIKVTPTQETLRAAKLIKAKSTRAVQAFTLLRELSDGFQYTEEVVGQQECPECHGEGTIEDDIPINELDLTKAQDYDKSTYVSEVIKCPCCNGKKTVPLYKRATDGYSSPKDNVFLELLDECAEIGRFVVWGGFTGTIERLLGLCHQHGWATLRYDKIVVGCDPLGNDIPVDDLLDAMDNSHPRFEELRATYPKVCVVAHPDAGGMALTFHASPISCYFSNSFKGESRMQSEDRIHRMGMDINRGATIIDLVQLKTDIIVLDNLKNKKKLQNMTMDVMDDAFTSSDMEMERYE